MFFSEEALALLSLKHRHLDTIEQIKSELLDLPLDFSTVTLESVEELISTIFGLHIAINAKIGESIRYPETLSFDTAVQPIIDLDIITTRAMLYLRFASHMHPDAALREQASIKLVQLNRSIKEHPTYKIAQKVFNYYFKTIFPKEIETLSAEKIQCVYSCTKPHLPVSALMKGEGYMRAINPILNLLIKSIEAFINLEQNKKVNNLSLTGNQLAGLSKKWLDQRRYVLDRYKVAINTDDIVTVLKYASNPDTRKTLHQEYHQDEKIHNTRLFIDIFYLKNKLRRFENDTAHQSTAANEPRSIEDNEARTKLENLTQALQKPIENTFTALVEFARINENDPSLTLQPSDLLYYMRLYQNAVEASYETATEKYFPIERVIDLSIALFERMFNLKLKPMSTDSGWSPDIKVFSIDNQDQKCIGTLYFDFFASPQKVFAKTLTEHNFILSGRKNISHLINTENTELTSITLCRKEFKKNECLSFNKVVDLFVSIGLAISGACLRKKYTASEQEKNNFRNFYGTFLERLCLEPETLQVLSSHTETHKTLPKAFAERLINTFKMRNTIHHQFELGMLWFDHMIHSISNDNLQTFITNLDGVLQDQLNRTGAPYLNESTCLLRNNQAMELINETGALHAHLRNSILAEHLYQHLFKGNPFSPQNGLKFRQVFLESSSSDNLEQLVCQMTGKKPTPEEFAQSLTIDMTHLYSYEKRVIEFEKEPAAKRMRL
ncbi:MAG: M3 family metallopeptidase [Gammaproteobacteria bacterium]|nr:M3 family metallopeptidase [Gammaproteobacteria bacterium]